MDKKIIRRLKQTAKTAAQKAYQLGRYDGQIDRVRNEARIKRLQEEISRLEKLLEVEREMRSA